MQYRPFEKVQSSKISPDDQKELYSFFMEYKRFPWYLILLLLLPFGIIFFIIALVWIILNNNNIKQSINTYIISKNISNFDLQDLKRRLTIARIIPKVSIKGITIAAIIYFVIITGLIIFFQVLVTLHTK